MTDLDFNLTGNWKGILYYPRWLPPLQFEAELRDHNGALAGETREIGDMGPGTGQQLIALLEGTRAGSRITFIKRYDHLGRSEYAVFYDGSLNHDGSEISGVWSIPDSWSGTFLMMRGKPDGVEEERKVAEPVS